MSTISRSPLSALRAPFAALALLLSLLTQAQGGGVEHYTSGKFDCAIFPPTYPAGLDGKPFKPSHDETDKALTALQSKLKDVKNDAGNGVDMAEIAKRITKYKIQLFGFADKKGERKLLLNCFLPDKKDKEVLSTWLTTMIRMDEGGDNFFTIKYDIASGALEELKF